LNAIAERPLSENEKADNEMIFSSLNLRFKKTIE
jgi:hypothetical protein